MEFASKEHDKADNEHRGDGKSERQVLLHLSTLHVPQLAADMDDRFLEHLQDRSPKPFFHQLSRGKVILAP